jgi:hypothetical protein
MRQLIFFCLRQIEKEIWKLLCLQLTEKMG